MARRGDAETLGHAVHQQLRRDLLTGRLRPGQRLKPSELRAEFGVSVGVIREALTRLTEQRLVTSEHNQGFRVASLSRQGLLDLTAVRVNVEGMALRLATERGDLQWESEVLAVHHRLANTPRRAPEDPDTMTEQWAAAHRAFHAKLIEACGVPMLIEICRQLSDSVELYRRWSAPASGGRRDVAAEHLRLVEAVVARDPERSLGALRDHYERTATIVLDSGLLVDEPEIVDPLVVQRFSG